MNGYELGQIFNILDWCESILCNSLPMSHCTQEEWDKTIQDWRKAKNDVFRIPAPEEEPKESMIPVGWIMEKMAEEEQKWEASCRSVSFHSDRVWALKYVLDEWVDYLADREMKKLGMGSN